MRLVEAGASPRTGASEHERRALLALTTLYGGDAEEARRLLNESLRHSLVQKNTILLAQVCTYLAETALWEGEFDRAAHWLAQSVGYYADPQRITMDEVMRLLIAARLATAQQHYPHAATLFGLADHAHGQIRNVVGGPIRTLA